MPRGSLSRESAVFWIAVPFYFIAKVWILLLVLFFVVAFLGTRHITSRFKWKVKGIVGKSFAYNQKTMRFFLHLGQENKTGLRSASQSAGRCFLGGFGAIIRNHSLLYNSLSAPNLTEISNTDGTVCTMLAGSWNWSFYLPRFRCEWKRQRGRFIFKLDRIGAIEYNDRSDM